MSTPAIPKFESHGALSYPLDAEGDIAEDGGYHAFNVLSGAGPDGEVTAALIGIIGASKHILSRSYNRITPRHQTIGYQDFEIRDGVLFGCVGAIEHNLGNWPPENLEQ